MFIFVLVWTFPRLKDFEIFSLVICIGVCEGFETCFVGFVSETFGRPVTRTGLENFTVLVSVSVTLVIDFATQAIAGGLDVLFDSITVAALRRSRNRRYIELEPPLPEPGLSQP